MPIVMAPENVDLKITKILVDEKTKRHLENLGILVNAIITILSKQDGNVIVKVKDGRLAINKEIALKIFVA
ncbi:MAG: ferrous iron transport protein A [Bacilli bacterium]|nr:ferrous iron transport protein A [Bacilli bacterium]